MSVELKRFLSVWPIFGLIGCGVNDGEGHFKLCLERRLNSDLDYRIFFDADSSTPHIRTLICSKSDCVAVVETRKAPAPIVSLDSRYKAVVVEVFGGHVEKSVRSISLNGTPIDIVLLESGRSPYETIQMYDARFGHNTGESVTEICK